MTGRDRRAEPTGSWRLPRGAPPQESRPRRVTGAGCEALRTAGGLLPRWPSRRARDRLPGPVAGAACRWQERRASRTGRSVAAAGPCLMLWGRWWSRAWPRPESWPRAGSGSRSPLCWQASCWLPAAPAGPPPGGAGEEPIRRAPTVPRIPPRWPRTQRCQLPAPPSREALASGSPRRRG